MSKWFCVGFAAIFVFGAALLASASAKEAEAVGLNEEVLASVRPDLDTSKVELTFKEVTNGSAHIQLSSPEPKFFSPTDFPWVEGTPLIDSTVSIENGKALLNYMFPIRGEYAMTVHVMDNRGQTIGTEQLTINIHENPKEVRNAIIFIGLLALFGLLCGYVFSKRRMRFNAV